MSYEKDYRKGYKAIDHYGEPMEQVDQFAFCKNCQENFFYKTWPPLVNSAVEFDFCSKCKPNDSDGQTL